VTDWVVWRGVTLDARTAAMMDQVAALSGAVYVRPTQGSASGGVAASAGTHDAGGAVDIAGQDAGMTQADREVIEAAGRQVGFAMWIRSPDQSDWPWHIHGIAVQPDGKHHQAVLSDGAHGQVIDYYEGRNGLASGAADDGPRHWVGVTWETYQPPTPPPPPPPRWKADIMRIISADGRGAAVIGPDYVHGISGQDELNLMVRLYGDPEGVNAYEFDQIVQWTAQNQAQT
jgi:hypothetical protein